ncbi:MAG: hypothetical protein ACYTFG_03400 [Planctomycetota bacterium]|jgi:tetratricopeptide (TPR) repeat protein
MNSDETAIRSPNSDGELPDRGGRKFLLAWIAGISSIAIVGGTSVAVLVIMMAGHPVGTTGPDDGGGRLAGTDGPGTETPITGDEAEVRALKERILDLEIKVMQMRVRIKEVDEETVDRLAERILTGDDQSAKGARAILALRGGTLGAVLADRLMALRSRNLELEAALILEREKSEAAIRDFLDFRKKSLEKARGDEKSKAAEFYELGLKAQEGGHHILAEEYYSRALDIDPTLASARNGRGSVRLALKKAEEALADFTTCTTLRPGYAPYEFNRGRALTMLGRHVEAAAAFDKVLVLEPGNEEALKEREEARTKRQ